MTDVTHGHALAERFDALRPELGAVAFRMLGSASEAEDAVQEAWLRLSRAASEGFEETNLRGWLRTTVTRVCLDLLRARKARRDDPTKDPALEALADRAQGTPEDEVLLADSVSRALLVVLDSLEPAERVAFVLHDMFGVAFDEIGRIVDRSPVAAKKLASRARQKVKGAPAATAEELRRQRHVVSAFLSAARAGDLAGLVAVLAPDVVRHADAAAVPPGGSTLVRGARAVAEGTVALASRSRDAALALIDGSVGLVIAPHGKLVLAVTFTVKRDKITEYDVIADRARLARLRVATLP